MKSEDTPPHSATPGLLSETEFVKRANELTDALRSEGVQEELDLPRIAVIGNQSAGKSSLVGAISEISVPRDPGTCTRCPMECRLRGSTQAWSCQISIRWEFDVDDQPVETITEVPFGVRITDKNLVERMLRRAQLAVLDSKTSKEHFIDIDDNSLATLLASTQVAPFSRNVVCIDLAGPGLPNLSFIDLPGIIQNADQRVLSLVRDMVTSYLAGNCLILVAITMSDDIENQSAARLAREADPAGLRTIGVLTKPDTVDPGSSVRTQWLQIIEGHRHPLKHGYYCVRQPNDVERQRGSDARKIEADYFEQTAPWSTSSCRDRFGTRNLVNTMANLLKQMTQRSIPGMKDKVTVNMRQCDRELSALPPVVTADPVGHTIALVTSFSQLIAEHVSGSTTLVTLVQKNNVAYDNYKTEIGQTAPKFVPFQSRRNTYGVSEEDQDDSGVYLDDIRAHIASSVTRQLPHHVPYAAWESLIRSFQETWAYYTEECFEAVKKNFIAALTEVAETCFGRFGALKAKGSSIVLEHFHACAETAKETIQYHLRSEYRMLYTQNKDYLAARRDMHLTAYMDVNQPGAGTSSPEQSQAPPTPPRTSASSASSAPASATSNGGSRVQDFKQELELMADVRAYFDVAHQRLLDDVQRAIDLQLLYEFCDSVQVVMLEKLGVGLPDAKARCDAYLAEDPSDAARREALLSRKKRLASALKTLNKFGL